MPDEQTAKDKLISRQDSYKMAFRGSNAQEVLKDLSIFCRENDSCVVPGDRDATLVLEGRREVILRIMDHLELSPDDLWTKYGLGEYVAR